MRYTAEAQVEARNHHCLKVHQVQELFSLDDFSKLENTAPGGDQDFQGHPAEAAFEGQGLELTPFWDFPLVSRWQAPPYLCCYSVAQVL